MQKLALTVLAVVLFPLTAAADLSGDFKVTVTDSDGKSTTQTGKIYLDGSPESKDRAVRMELKPEGAKEAMIFLTRPQDKAMYMVMPEAKAYMKMSFDEGLRKAPRAPGQGLAPSDFKTVGSERVNGIKTTVKEAPLHEGEKTTGTIRIYVAPALGNEPIKSEIETDKGMHTESIIENPKTDSLAGNLFTVPAGYTETKLPSLNQMMQGLEKGAQDESGDAAKDQQEKAADDVRRGLRGKLPF